MNKKKKIVTGVIGLDIHYGGNVIMQYALREAGFEVVALGTQVSQQEFIDSAKEAGADAILVNSMYGHAAMDCRGFGEACSKAGLNVPLYIGGNLQVGAKDSREIKWADVEKQFKEMGFTRVYPRGVALDKILDDLREDLVM